MQCMNGKVSIVIPMFNRATLISETVASVKRQTYENFECIIIDDGSTDNSLEVARQAAKDEIRFKIFSRESPIKGACRCRNEGLEKASGEYIMFLDSDDLLAADCLRSRVQRLSEYQDCDFIVNQIGLFDHQSYQVKSLWSSLQHQDDLHAFLNSEGWQTSSTFFRTDFVKRYAFDEAAMSWQDVDFHIRILLDRPVYLKFPNMDPDVYMRDSGLERISNTNLSFPRILSRITLYRKLEKMMDSRQYYNYLEPFRIYNFKFLEIAALVLSIHEFKAVFNIWKTSKTSSGLKSHILKIYLLMQANLKIAGLRPLCSVFYRLIRIFINRKLLTSEHRKIVLKETVALSRLK